MYKVEDFFKISELEYNFGTDDLNIHIIAEGSTIEDHVDALNNSTLEAINLVKILPSAQLWRNMTNGEADQVAAIMDTQPFRIRQILMTANSLRSDDDLWPLLEQIATQLFGAKRAAEILTP